MRQAVAKQGDQIVALDTHVVFVPVGGALVPTPLPHPFAGIINAALSPNVNVMGRPAASVDSTADNVPAHVVTPPGQGFQKPPANVATIVRGSRTVRVNGKAAARHGDAAETCNDPGDLPVGQVIATGTVMAG